MESKPEEIESLTMTKTYVINRYTYHTGSITLNEKLDIFVNLYADETLVKSACLSIQAGVYAAWGLEDGYVIEVINRNLNNIINAEANFVIAQ